MLSLAKQVAWSLPVAIAIRDLVGNVVQVEGPSMQPTLNPDLDKSSDWVLVEKVSYKWFHDYRRGDVAVLWAPDDPQALLVKRVVGLQEDVVWDDLRRSTQKIPAGRCWIEGDNAPHSADSRSMFGPVHLGLLEGRAVCVVWPPSRMCMLSRHVPPGKVIEVDRTGVGDVGLPG
mmetsp:Transcript_6454/g.14333  ORF Transcript_6454/g.14333 Transcript_6454/m.14333 type:complete len:174 (+) Transcript_6454:183-704(+)|eukprot:CAMPEP_0202919772 /NCGR_PEP_ID=MMETSP1392-20130828/76507_1 /ASSEMBLY_ACC=CAM_ASM_000868 /TAXON_ID=225041 /ORGANISM="Chlamydomonas chlamydogama, Strain SAG 11-48b" /LENGTH=173 /DNA_ID=CAMNT_0049613231 /DNA_START=149 /DNA_END=670 /DNA_ORIENTATION=+